MIVPIDSLHGDAKFFRTNLKRLNHNPLKYLPYAVAVVPTRRVQTMAKSKFSNLAIGFGES
ncbi:MAG: hypothetical protein RLZZ165_1480 [Bacteroidota bacterium]|jgi:hypothetical protein